jgi:hypothetical protein
MAENAGPRTQVLPLHTTLAPEARRELGGLDKQISAALLEAFGRRCHDQHLPREDERLPIGRGKALRSIRITLAGSQFRLVYFQVRDLDGAERTRVASSRATKRPIRFVGLLAWGKKDKKLGSARAKTAWDRSIRWLEVNQGYGRI